MKKLIVSTVVLFMGFGLLKAQNDSNIGLMFGYGSEIEQVGVGVNAEFAIVNNLTISPSFLFYFPEKYYYITRNMWEVNGNLNYYFLSLEQMGAYGLAGINYSHLSAKGDYMGISSSDGEGKIGANIGGGFKFHLSEKFAPFAEVKYVINDYDQVVAMIGMKYKF